jgi:hypothetical protein
MTYWIVGLAIMLALACYGLSIYLPNADEAKKLSDNAELLKAEGDKLPQAKKRVAKAQETLKKKDLEWQQRYEAQMPPSSLALGGIDVSENAWQLVVDTPKYRDNVQKEVNAQLHKGGVKVLGTGPFVPSPPETASTIMTEYFNYPAIPFPVVIFDLGTIQVEGTYDQIMAHIRSYSHMPHYMAVTDGLRLEGTSPKLRATYSLTIVGFIEVSKVFPPVPESASAGGSLAGGFGGGAAGVTGGIGPGRPRGGGGIPGVPPAGAIPGGGAPTKPSAAGVSGGGGGGRSKETD